jgi:large repetitive protein
MRWKILVGALAAAAAVEPAGLAQFGGSLATAIAGFTDVNGNGALDCGEPLTILVAVAGGNPLTAQVFSGTLAFPAAGSSGLIFVPGSVKVEYDLTVDCSGVVTAGNSPEDLSGAASFNCSNQTGPANVKPVFTVSYQALYFNASSPSYVATAHAHVVPAGGSSLELDATAGNNPPPSGICGGTPNQLQVVKTESGTAAPGATIVYAISATDTSGLGDGGVQFTDVVPQHTTFSAAGSDPGWVCTSPAAGALCRLPVGNIGPNATVVRYFAVTVESPLAAGVASLDNTACARNGPTTVLGCGGTSTPTAGSATAKLVKALLSGSGMPGGTLVYQLTVSDVGNQDLGPTTLAETVPANTTFDAAASAAGWSCGGTAAGSSCTLGLGPIGAGASSAARFAVDVAGALPAGTTAIGNTACVNGAGGATLDCNTLTTPTTGTPALAVHKSVAGSAVPGGTLTYTIAVQNVGNEGAAGVAVTDTVPANTSFAAAGSSPGWSCAPGAAAGSVCSLSIAALPAGATASLTFAVTVALPLPADATAVANTACAALPPLKAGMGGAGRGGAGTGGAGARGAGRGGTSTREAGARGAGARGSAVGGSSACDSVSTPTLGTPRLGLAKTYGGGAVLPGATLVFQLQVANGGDQDAGPVTLAETVPAHSSFASGASAAGWSCNPGPAAGSACALTLPGLAAGAVASVAFAVRADATLPPATVISNAACATSTSGGKTVSACSSTATPPELQSDTSLAVALKVDADGSGGPTPGDTLRYTLTVPNGTASTLAALVAKLDLDPHEALVAGSVVTDHGTVATGNGPGDATVVVELGDLAAGQTATVQFDATINRGLPVGTTEITAQAETSGANIPTDPSGDPATPAIDDNPTSIAVTVGAPPAANVPTLGGAGLAALAAMLVGGGVAVLRRRPGAV